MSESITKDWTAAKASELIQHIVSTHHEFLRRELPQIAALFKQAYDKHAETGSQLCGRIQFFYEKFTPLAEELYAHLDKEEMILYPTILGYEKAAEQRIPCSPPPFGSVRHPIGVMESEHVEALAALDAMRERSENYTPPDHAGSLGKGLHQKLKDLDTDLREHIRLENDILHKYAQKLEEENRGW